MRKLPKKQAIFLPDEWNIIEDGFHPEKNFMLETIFTVANGYLGLRGNLDEDFPDKSQSFKATYINGFYEEYDITYPEGGYGFAKCGEAMVNVADVKTFEITIDGEKFNLFSGKIDKYVRKLDMRNGTLVREVIWESNSGKKIYIIFERLACFKRQHLGAINIRIKPLNFSGRIKIVSKIDGNSSNLLETEDVRVGSGIEKFPFETIKAYCDELNGFLMQKTKKSRLSYGCMVDHVLSIKEFFYKSFADKGKNLVIFEIEFDAKQDMEYSLTKYFSYFTQRDVEEDLIEEGCAAEILEAKKIGFENLLKEQRKFLETFWENADVVVKGDPKIQQAIRFSLFSLLQSTGRNGISNIAAKGLTGEGYGGHYFWDSEIYIMPFFIFTHSEIARMLLIHRYNLLDAARQRAKELHHRGALYPWRTIAGKECSAYFPAGTAQYHINADIVYAIKKYFEATDDLDFIKNYGAEIVFESARFYADLVHFSEEKDGKFCIFCVTGPDEYTALVDNNAYTNYMVQMNLEFAVRLYNLLKEADKEAFERLCNKLKLSEQEIELWKKIADNMYLPYNAKLKVIPQDDSFIYKKRLDLSKIPEEQFPLLLHWHYLDIYRYQVCKQPDVLLLIYLLREKFSYEDLKNNYEYYEPITTHDSSLSPAIFSILAVELNLLEKAYEYFRYTARMDLDDLNDNTKDGIHAACMGGTWQAIVFGFGGMRTGKDLLSFSPRLPKDIDYISFKVKYKGCTIKVEITKNKAIYTLLAGEAILLSHYSQSFELKSGQAKEFVIET
ncbi:glycoside hydrolase family 65 protein [Caldicellulosiruptor changbaiensis]|uniref:Glycoside hydrolase family 65 protein n=1 Tax=Caldicellulosiruptor changbaiensis TaxID=1222016 RepID=A0A3T0D2X0_9FIRM|nr:glycosyl hydrolase family 65 protein [Caldicellulosiruptor changbaiensis]AZT89555.1 glycoside hydrolase family 65 protein [Caldicellulosiruptor changbaiensis]